MKLPLLWPPAVAVLAMPERPQWTEKNMMQMQRLMDVKLAAREKPIKNGVLDEGGYKFINRPPCCVNGKAGEFSCNKVDMTAFLGHQDMWSGAEKEMIFGVRFNAFLFESFPMICPLTLYVDLNADDGLEFFVIGQSDGATISNIWPDRKVIDGYVYIGSEAPGHGLQVFDMRNVQLPPLLSLSVARDATMCLRVYSRSRWKLSQCRRTRRIADENTEYLLLDDELDEKDGTYSGKAGHTHHFYIVNIANLAKPKLPGYYQPSVKSIDP
ncbi:hypothetical protein AJ78_03591 [Emergomyces pasteurianus Ep9510]|uniref:Uncharacterized protein n=1 Tax=Emergomyces pasteurianus Ep9510 TaxID=1447872 RepID=A0A1J9QJY7_9EURO|nr:hypothetical protein AJ78_03591 [Emergomyces pasteurianus Ep9510]